MDSKFAFIRVHLRPLLRGWSYYKHLDSITLAGSHATRLLDPANSNNVVSDLLAEVEKLHISRKARMYL